MQRSARPGAGPVGVPGVPPADLRAGVYSDADFLPVLMLRGRYRDFARLETPILGVLSRCSRIATNVYEALVASRGKPILFFPARFDLPQCQPLDGYAYRVGVQAFERRTGTRVPLHVSTDAQGALLNERGGGTVPHAVRADTSPNLRDRSVPPSRDPRMACGVTPVLITMIRRALDRTPAELGLAGWGGFHPGKIRFFGSHHAPVDMYGGGSHFLRGEPNDCTADDVRVRIGGRFHIAAKTGRAPRTNRDLRPVRLRTTGRRRSR